MSPELRVRIVGKNETGSAFNQVVGDAKRASAAVESSGRAMSRSMQAANTNVGNLAAQFNDIGVQLAGGSSPFLVALQQGTQISQAIGPMGAGGAVKALGSAFLSLLSPISLLTIGIIGVGGAALQWLMSVNSEGTKAEDVLKEHEQWLTKILAGYDGVQQAAAKYHDELTKLPVGVVSAEIGQGLAEQRDLIAAQAEMVGQLNERIRDYVELLSQPNDMLLGQLSISEEDLGRLRQFVGETDKLNISSTTSLDRLGALMTTTRQLMDTIDDPASDAFLQDIYSWADGLRAARAEAARLASIIGGLSFPAVPSSFTNAIDALGKLSPTQLTERQQALAALNTGLGASQDEIQRAALRKEYEVTLKRIETNEALAAAAKKATASMPKAASAVLEVDAALVAAAENSKRLATTIAGSLTNAATGFFSTVMKGGDAIAALKTQLSSLADQLLNSALNSFFTKVIGGLIGNPFGSLGNDVGTGATFGGVQAFLKSAKGNVVSGPGIAAYSGSVVSRPTLFPFARGAGLMGEAGPEAILPLRRGSDGKLGVTASTSVPAMASGASRILVELSPGLIGHILEMAKQQTIELIRSQSPLAVATAQRNGGF